MHAKKMADLQASQGNSRANISTSANASSSGAEIRKSDTELVRITISEYRGRSYVRIRAWYREDAGEFKPRNTGVSIRLTQLSEVVQGLMLAARAADLKGAS
jgi:hypothetical protein